jgi:hypothetical protein
MYNTDLECSRTPKSIDGITVPQPVLAAKEAAINHVGVERQLPHQAIAFQASRKTGIWLMLAITR